MWLIAELVHYLASALALRAPPCQHNLATDITCFNTREPSFVNRHIPPRIHTHTHFYSSRYAHKTDMKFACADQASKYEGEAKPTNKTI